MVLDHLTPTERRLALRLQQGPCSPGQLVEQLYEHSFGSLRVHIHNMRRKLVPVECRYVGGECEYSLRCA